ncbi:hypothetical protein ABVT39_015576 [Epinephelus coioides]
MSYGPCEEGGPAILQVHRKDGQACLLMPWDTMFSEEQQEQRRGRRLGECKGGERALKESGGHMSPLLLSAWILQAFVLNIDAEAENKPCPNTGVGWWTGEDRPQTRCQPTISSLSVQLWSPQAQTTTLTSRPGSQLSTPTS